MFPTLTAAADEVSPGKTVELKADSFPAAAAKPLRIMPLGDSITRGSYLAPANKDGKSTGLANPLGGGWRKALQDKLRAAGIAFDFVGELNYGAFGQDGVVDAGFDPDHHGLAGFTNTEILRGGVVPTPADVLTAKGVKEIKVPGIVEVLKKHQPDVILLMSGTNGFDAPGRDKLIQTIGETSDALLLVATILPQRAPRAGWDKVEGYNASLPAIVATQQAAGKRIVLVDLHAALTTDDLLPDGVHPSQAGMEKMASAWFQAISTTTATATDTKFSEATQVEGVLVHQIVSPRQAAQTQIRVLLPEERKAEERFPVVYVLPVEAGRENRYGDGLNEIQMLELHNKYRAIFVAPTFAHLPWYIDHASEPQIRQESYFLEDVLPFVERTYPVQPGRAGQFLLGFSKSGWGAVSLLVRHPNLFERAAAWDAPFMMERLGKYGTTPIFGTEEVLARYYLPMSLRQAAEKTDLNNRLIITGYGSFRAEHQAFHKLLEEEQVPHVYRDGPQRKHDWHSGWVAESVELLFEKAK